MHVQQWVHWVDPEPDDRSAEQKQRSAEQKQRHADIDDHIARNPYNPLIDGPILEPVNESRIKVYFIKDIAAFNELIRLYARDLMDEFISEFAENYGNDFMADEFMKRCHPCGTVINGKECNLDDDDDDDNINEAVVDDKSYRDDIIMGDLNMVDDNTNYDEDDNEDDNEDDHIDGEEENSNHVNDVNDGDVDGDANTQLIATRRLLQTIVDANEDNNEDDNVDDNEKDDDDCGWSDMFP